MGTKHLYRVALFSVVLYAFAFSVFNIITMGSVYDVITVYQLIILSVSFWAVIVMNEIHIKYAFILIFLYQVTFVYLLYTVYILHYGNPFGYNPVDAVLYHTIAVELRNLSFANSIRHLLTNVSVGDLGFTIYLQAIYKLPLSNPIATTKFINIVFHLFSCVYVYRLSYLIFNNIKISEVSIIIYGLNPISVYFNSLGLKEPLFALIVIMAFYYLYKSNKNINLIYYIVGIILALLTGLFRVAFSIFIIIGFAYYWFINIKGKYKLHKRFALAITGVILIIVAFALVKDELTGKLQYDFIAIATHRIGTLPSLPHYVILSISGLIGPFPSLNNLISSDFNRLESIGNLYKIILSYYFVAATYLLYKRKNNSVYPIYITYFLNALVLIILAATLDHRFIYPLVSIYFIIIAYGICEYRPRLIPGIISMPVYYIFITIILIAYNLR